MKSFREYLAENTTDKYKEIIGFTYDNNANYTKPIDELLKSKKGICYDFVNYLYHKNKGGDCYFIHFNNKEHSTHTFYMLNGNWIEATPKTDEPLKFIPVEKCSVNDVVKRLVAQNVKKLDNPDEPPYDLVKYTPDNKKMSVKEFICKRFDEGNIPYDK